MGTRGAIAVRALGETKAAYNHFDSYPSHLGAAVLKFAHHIKDNVAHYFDLAVNLAPVHEDVPPTPEQIEKLKPYTDLSVSERSTSDWYCLLRNTQGDLGLTLQAGYFYPTEVGQDEWSYVVDLDSEKLEVWEGNSKVATFDFDELPPTLEGHIPDYY
jgi:hypothetical protein